MRNLIRATVIAISSLLSCAAGASTLPCTWDMECERMDRVERGTAELERLLATGEW